MHEFWLDQLQGERAGVVDHFKRDVVTMGRGDDVDLLFDTAGISWEHAEIRQRDGDWWLVDSGSTNGTYVNDERAHNARLKKADVIRLGKRGPVMRFLLAAPKTSESSGDRPKAPPPRPSKRPRKPSEAEIAVLSPEELAGPGEGHSNLVPAGALYPGEQRGGMVPLVILAGLTISSLVLLALLFVEYDAQGKDLEKAREQATTLRVEINSAQASQAEEVRSVEARVRGQLGEQLQTSENKGRRLERELKSARTKAGDQARRIKTLNRDLTSLRRKRAKGDDGEAKSWKDIERRLRGSVVMIACVLEGVDKNGKRVQLNGFGSGFFASSQGHIVTNKHVVEPWKFREMALRIAREGIEIDRKSYQLHAWRGGTRFVRKKKDGKGYELDPSSGYSTLHNTLKMVRTAPDKWHVITGGKAVNKVQVHVMSGNGDIAILKAKASRIRPIPVARSSEVETLNEVMVLGFPAGPSFLQSGVALPSPALGNVRNPEAKIKVSAPMIPGNSGGPLIDHKGRVIGICTQVVKGTETLGSCLRIEHAMRLIHGGSW
ncbi:MAG: trypsin-like peptidase domain-containing protein [Planctomycetes bacterium]|nr:trypsin-like peptidase domain-containing protein [Planctomycetota bacterium]